MDAIRAGNKENSPLLKLPGEIRNTIYRLSLVSNKTIEIKPSTIRGQRSLLQTCHQLREEASKIYYGENTFSIISKSRAFQELSGFLFDKSVGRLVTKLTLFFILTVKQEAEVDKIMGAIVLGDINSESWLGHNLREEVRRCGTAAVRELQDAGVGVDALIIALPNKDHEDRAEPVLKNMRDIYDAHVRKMMKMYGA